MCNSSLKINIALNSARRKKNWLFLFQVNSSATYNPIYLETYYKYLAFSRASIAIFCSYNTMEIVPGRS